jgi:hypothetical protein
MYPRAFPSSVRDLRVSFSPLSDRAGLVGAAFLALDQLLGPAALPVWIDSHSPAGHTAADLHSTVPETRKDLP